jgi:hypothetical protein
VRSNHKPGVPAGHGFACAGSRNRRARDARGTAAAGRSKLENLAMHGCPPGTGGGTGHALNWTRAAAAAAAGRTRELARPGAGRTVQPSRRAPWTSTTSCMRDILGPVWLQRVKV